MEGERKSFQEKQKLKESVITKPAMIKGDSVSKEKTPK